MAKLPLYAEAVHPTGWASGNAGLYWDKFFDLWDNSYSGLQTSGGDQTAKQQWLKKFEKRVGNNALLKEHHSRQALLTNKRGGRQKPFKTEWRFVSGLGYSHAVENGFGWHHALGVPYLPGSSVKGLVNGWLRDWCEDGTKADKLLGTKEGVGRVIFHDALPLTVVKLEADLMTPHYGPYFDNVLSQEESAGLNQPGDYYDPTPIPFLTVAADQAFLFTVTPRTPEDGEACREAFEYLETALMEIGAGGKTAVNYGKFEPKEE